jgi:glycosyltransferase involved in cell wall biosynthesis
MAARGGAVIYEIDDLLTALAPHLLHHAEMNRARHWVLRCLSAADLVTVSTPRLARALGCTEGRHVIVPNSAFPQPGAPLPVPDPAAPVSLLFAASDRLAGAIIYPLLRDLQQRLGPRLRVAAVGIAADDLRLAGVAVEPYPMMSRADFVSWARMQPNPVAVIPLDGSEFSACKSAIKWFDYAEAGIPTLASDVGPYHDTIDDGVTGTLVPADPSAWAQALETALADAGWRERIAVAARAEVRLHHHAGVTVEAWRMALHRARQIAAERASLHVLRAVWREPLVSLVDAGVIALRRINRERVERRRRTREHAG